jgi:uncharacterized NAD-dependent epimerase/dehydratase family protein
VYGAGGAYSWMPLTSVSEMIRRCEDAIRPLRESAVIGVALNTSDLDDAAAALAVSRITEETGLPTVDPVRSDPAPLVDAILTAHSARAAASE